MFEPMFLFMCFMNVELIQRPSVSRPLAPISGEPFCLQNRLSPFGLTRIQRRKRLFYVFDKLKTRGNNLRLAHDLAVLKSNKWSSAVL